MAKKISQDAKRLKKASAAVAGTGAFSLIQAPVLSEKSSGASTDKSVAVFRVGRESTKLEIKLAVEKVFKVEVDSVRTCNFIGKVKRTQRSVGRRPSFKKAYVTLKPGFSIDLVEGV